MRELKFRAWDGHKMWYGETVGKTNPNNGKEYKQNLLITMDGEIRTCQWYEDGVTMHNFGKYELMQYTGLKDKNGKEIYSGDKLYNPADREPFYIIQWNDKNACWELGDNGFPIGKYQLNEFWEVIGNIYENR